MRKVSTVWTHLVTMLFCQFSKLNSLRDVTNGLRSASGNLNHLGLLQNPEQTGQSFRSMPDTHSGRWRTVIPDKGGQLIRSMADSYSG